MFNKKKYWFFLPLTCLIAILSFWLWLPGCYFDSSGIPPDRDWYECSAELWHCRRLPDNKPDLNLSPGQGSSANTPPSANAISYPLLANKDRTYHIYHDKQVVVYSISDGELKGSLLIPAGFGEWNNANPEYWDIEFKNQVEAVYVAYDARAKTPSWLKKDYQPYRDINNAQAHIKTSLIAPQSVGSGYPQFLKLNLHRYTQPITAGMHLVLPGNSYEPENQNKVKDWQEISEGDPLMYTVLVKPKVNWDCSNGHKKDTVAYDGCFERSSLEDVSVTQKEAESSAKQEWERKYPFNAKKKVQCATEMDCTSANTLIGGALTMQSHAYLYSSEIEFVTPSSAKVTIGNSSHNQKVTGRLHFEYQFKTHDMKLNSLRLFVDPLSTDHGRFSEIAIYMIETVMAQCQGSPVSNTPCDQYELKPATLFCAENFKRNGKPHLFISENSTVMPISIDHQGRTFTIKGSLASSAMVNGDTLPINVDLNLVGKFVNFAPVPFGEESSTFSQCVEGINMNPIHLNAAGSYDVYEPLPAYQAVYKWFEDYGTLTEKAWGQGKAVTIGSGQLAFGAHDITLVVEDAHGVAADTTLQVEVADTIPPKFAVPADVTMMFLEDPGPVKVNIGKAYASDMCSSEVSVTNDAPRDLKFPSGKTTDVNWRAEDLRGNVVTGIQRIHVIVLKPFGFQFDRAIFLINQSLKQARFDLARCGNADACPVKVTPLVNSLRRLVDLSAEAELPEQQKRVVMKTAAQLELTRAALAGTQERIDRSNQDSAERTQLRTSIRQDMENALALMPKIVD